MKIILPVPKRVEKVKTPPVSTTGNVQLPTDLTTEEWLDAIGQSNFEISQNIKDRIELLQRTVRLSLNHGIEYTEQGPMYLELLPPCTLNILNNFVTFEVENAGLFPIGPLITYGGALWLLLPIGKKYTVDFTVQSKRKNTYFHVGVRYKDYSDEFTVESTDNVQHLTFNVDTTKSVFYGIDIMNMNSDRKRALRHKEWIFFNCTVVRLD